MNANAGLLLRSCFLWMLYVHCSGCKAGATDLGDGSTGKNEVSVKLPAETALSEGGLQLAQTANQLDIDHSNTLAERQRLLATKRRLTDHESGGAQAGAVEAADAGEVDVEVIDAPEPISHAAVVASAIFGYGYFITWSISFYPQIILNFRRKRVDGMSFDFTIFNFIGFGIYSVYNAVQYAAQIYGGAASAVQVQDVCFALHGFLLCSTLMIQCLIYDKGKQNFGKATIITLSTLGALIIFVGFLSAIGIVPFVSAKPTTWDDRSPFEQFASSLSFIAFLGYTKSFISLIKSIPQVLLNYTAKSTRGLSISNFVLDGAGSFFSIFQNSIDAWNYSDSYYIIGNIPKLLISLASIGYDVIFVLQYFIYGRGAPAGIEEKLEVEKEMLLLAPTY